MLITGIPDRVKIRIYNRQGNTSSFGIFAPIALADHEIDKMCMKKADTVHIAG